jgi:hypothetical protein
MIALVLEIGPRLGIVVVLMVAIVTVGGYLGAWGGERWRSPFGFDATNPSDDERLTPTRTPSDAQ